MPKNFELSKDLEKYSNVKKFISSSKKLPFFETEQENKLVKGVQICADNLFSNYPNYEELIKNPQKPTNAIIACSDSRVPVEMVFNAKPGEIFVMRNIGAIVPPYIGRRGGGVSAFLNYSLILGIKEINILSHAYCGAVNHALSKYKETGKLMAGSPYAKIIHDEKERIMAKYPELPFDLQRIIGEKAIDQKIRNHPDLKNLWEKKLQEVTKNITEQYPDLDNHLVSQLAIRETLAQDYYIEEIDAWVEIIGLAAKKTIDEYPNLNAEEQRKRSEKEALKISFENLFTYPNVANLVADGKLTVKGWLFSAGELIEFNPTAKSEEKEFTTLVNTPRTEN